MPASTTKNSIRHTNQVRSPARKLFEAKPCSGNDPSLGCRAFQGEVLVEERPRKETVWRTSRHHYTFLSAVVASTLLLLSGCSATSPLTPAGRSAPVDKSQVVTVRRSDVTPVVTFDSNVETSVPYQITAPVSGLLEVAPDGQMAILDANRTSHPIAVPPLATNVTTVVPAGNEVTAGLPIASATYSGFALVGSVSGLNLIRFRQPPVSALAQISGAGQPFECTLLDDKPSQEVNASGTQSLACVVPDSQNVVDGMTGIVAVRFATTHDALVLPIDAIAGSTGNGLAFLETSRGTHKVSVRLGDSDGINIVVKSGVKLGDKVRIPSPSILSE